MTAPPIRLPSGVRDFLPRAAARRRALAEGVMTVFEAWGFARIITPVFEVADVLERGLGASARADAIRFVEPGTGEIVALRPDITPQIARIVATRMAEVAGPIRLCYEGAVFRLAGELGQREILQAGVELVGAPAATGDAELIAVASAALAELGLVDARLDLGHVMPVNHVLAAAPDRDVRARLAAAISRKDRAGVRVAARSLAPDIAQLADQLVDLWGPARATLARALALPWPDAVSAALRALDATLTAAAALVGATELDATIDLGDLHGFEYYTGLKLAAYAAGAPDAILRGGRYDELLGRYGKPAGATGFAIDLEAAAQAQRAAGVAPPRAALGIAVTGEHAVAIARALRAAGLRAVVDVAAPEPEALRDLGLDAAIAGDTVITATGARHPAAAAIEAARAGDTGPLIAILRMP